MKIAGGQLRKENETKSKVACDYPIVKARVSGLADLGLKDRGAADESKGGGAE
ncbi:hypothetical protein [Pseudorhizobium endolithicum]|uniref:hypothetical protein n=1 Tax=Pseudorhizobium endolithicum TaxID=1191678 RepID=UPI00163D1F75|nr:hypothetical protein [Pseudorhizobium endolithicum]